MGVGPSTKERAECIVLRAQGLAPFRCLPFPQRYRRLEQRPESPPTRGHGVRPVDLHSAAYPDNGDNGNGASRRAALLSMPNTHNDEHARKLAQGRERQLTLQEQEAYAASLRSADGRRVAIVRLPHQQQQQQQRRHRQLSTTESMQRSFVAEYADCEELGGVSSKDTRVGEGATTSAAEPDTADNIATDITGYSAGYSAAEGDAAVGGVFTRSPHSGNAGNNIAGAACVGTGDVGAADGDTVHQHRTPILLASALRQSRPESETRAVTQSHAGVITSASSHQTSSDRHRSASSTPSMFPSRTGHTEDYRRVTDSTGRASTHSGTPVRKTQSLGVPSSHPDSHEKPTPDQDGSVASALRVSPMRSKRSDTGPSMIDHRASNSVDTRQQSTPRHTRVTPPPLSAQSRAASVVIPGVNVATTTSPRQRGSVDSGNPATVAARPHLRAMSMPAIGHTPQATREDHRSDKSVAELPSLPETQHSTSPHLHCSTPPHSHYTTSAQCPESTPPLSRPSSSTNSCVLCITFPPANHHHSSWCRASCSANRRPTHQSRRRQDSEPSCSRPLVGGEEREGNDVLKWWTADLDEEHADISKSAFSSGLPSQQDSRHTTLFRSPKVDGAQGIHSHSYGPPRDDEPDDDHSLRQLLRDVNKQWCTQRYCANTPTHSGSTCMPTRPTYDFEAACSGFCLVMATTMYCEQAAYIARSGVCAAWTCVFGRPNGFDPASLVLACQCVPSVPVETGLPRPCLALQSPVQTWLSDGVNGAVECNPAVAKTCLVVDGSDRNTLQTVLWALSTLDTSCSVARSRDLLICGLPCVEAASLMVQASKLRSLTIFAGLYGDPAAYRGPQREPSLIHHEPSPSQQLYDQLLYEFQQRRQHQQQQQNTARHESLFEFALYTQGSLNEAEVQYTNYMLAIFDNLESLSPWAHVGHLRWVFRREAVSEYELMADNFCINRRPTELSVRFVTESIGRSCGKVGLVISLTDTLDFAMPSCIQTLFWALVTSQAVRSLHVDALASKTGTSTIVRYLSELIAYSQTLETLDIDDLFSRHDILPPLLNAIAASSSLVYVAVPAILPEEVRLVKRALHYSRAIETMTVLMHGVHPDTIDLTLMREVCLVAGDGRKAVDLDCQPVGPGDVSWARLPAP
eukprot:scpid40513/ scgid0957/ 